MKFGWRQTLVFLVLESGLKGLVDGENDGLMHRTYQREISWFKPRAWYIARIGGLPRVLFFDTDTCTAST